jgi:transcriptional regulator with XRE-family HTH domain
MTTTDIDSRQAREAPSTTTSPVRATESGPRTSGPVSPVIAGLIREGRLRKGLNQDDLAQQAGVSRTTLHHLERGAVQKPRASTLARLATVLDLDPDLLWHSWQQRDLVSRDEPGARAAAADPVLPVAAADDSVIPEATLAKARPLQDDRVQGELAGFDWGTNRAAREFLEQNPAFLADFTPEERDMLVSQVGVGGGLTAAGVRQAADRIREDRETISQLHVILQTHLRGATQQVIAGLYRSVAILPEAGSASPLPPG